MGLIDTEQFRKNFFKLDTEFRPSQIDAVFNCINNCELVDGVAVIRCRDCKFFEFDEVETVKGINIITAHAICKKWSKGCKTREYGFCHLAERRTE